MLNARGMRVIYLAFSAVPKDEWPVPNPDAVAHLYVALPDGSDLHRLTTQDDYSERDPVWSPDGSMLVYETERVRDQTHVTIIYRMALDTLSPVYLAEGAFPRWMPDGQSVLYVAAGDEPWVWEIIEGRSLEKRRLFTEIDSQSVITHATASPDGTLFAITLWDEEFGFRLVTDVGQTIEKCALSSRYVDTPMWSPDGRYLAFSAADDEEGTAHGICVLSRATGDVKRISGRSYEGPFVWSPTGEYLAITDYAGSHVGLYVVSRDGAERHHLLDLNVGGAGEVYIPPPTWSSDGQYLAVKTLTPIGWEIIVHDVAENHIVHRLNWVPNPFMDISDPVWQP